MKLYAEEAVVLKSVPMRGADRVLTLYSPVRGKFRAVAHGVDKPSSRKRGSVQPFTFGKFLLRRGRDLDSLDQCEGVEYFKGLRQSLEGLSYASYLSELVDAFSPEGEVTPGIFELIMESFSLLGGENHRLLARSFEMKLLCLAGYRPHLSCCAVCGAANPPGKILFVPALGGVVCRDCAGQEKFFELSPAAVEMLKVISAWPLARLSRLKAGSAREAEMKKALRGFIYYHLEGGLKSVKFLDWLEGD
jgi:DNA repair protein RecO (recombination protein O)